MKKRGGTSPIGQKWTLPPSVLLMHMRTDDFVRVLMNQLVIEISGASLTLIIRTGASVPITVSPML